jgi:hypothetical protein
LINDSTYIGGRVNEIRQWRSAERIQSTSRASARYVCNSCDCLSLWSRNHMAPTNQDVKCECKRSYCGEHHISVPLRDARHRYARSPIDLRVRCTLAMRISRQACVSNSITADPGDSSMLAPAYLNLRLGIVIHVHQFHSTTLQIRDGLAATADFRIHSLHNRVTSSVNHVQLNVKLALANIALLYIRLEETKLSMTTSRTLRRTSKIWTADNESP